MNILYRHLNLVRQAFLLLIISSVLVACGGGDTNATTPSTAKAIKAFSLNGNAGVISGPATESDSPSCANKICKSEVTMHLLLKLWGGLAVLVLGVAFLAYHSEGDGNALPIEKLIRFRVSFVAK